MDYTTESISIKHVLTQDERNNMSLDLAQKQIDISELEDEKKGVVATYKAKIDSLSGNVKLLSRQIKDGFIMITINAEKRRNFIEKKWDYYHPESGELVKSEPFQGRDFQLRTDDVLEDPNKTLADNIKDFAQEHNLDIEIINPLNEMDPDLEVAEYSTADPELEYAAQAPEKPKRNRKG